MVMGRNQDTLVSLRFLTFLVVVSILVQIVVSLFAFSRVNSAKEAYRVNERDFVSAVERSVGEFLEGFVERDTSSSSTNSSLDVRQEYLEGGCIWDSPRRGMLLRVRGVDYAVGDYYGNGVVVGIHPGRVYVKSADGVIIYRPVRVPDDRTRPARPVAGTEEGEIERAL